MNKKELLKKFQELGIPEHAYYLEGGLPNEADTLNKVDENHWEVYYSERGLKSDLTTFNNEEDACEFLYNKVVENAKAMGYIK